MYKINFYAPDNAVEIVKQAMFNAGAGRIGNYDYCCWQCPGVGQFRPLENSNPAIGSKDQLEIVEEFKVEMVCEDKYIKSVIDALHKSHPYEEPAYDVIKIEDI